MNTGIGIGTGTALLRRRRSVTGVTATLVNDTFTRADSTTAMGTPEVGPAWTVVSGTWGIRTNKGYNVGDGNGQTITIDPGGSTVYTASMDITGEFGATNFRFADLILHYVDASNYLFLRFIAPNYNLTKRIAAVNTTAVQTAFTPVTGTTYNYKVVANDGTFDVYLDNVLKMSYTLLAGERTTFLVTNKVGIRLEKGGTPVTNADVDNFKVTNP